MVAPMDMINTEASPSLFDRIPSRLFLPFVGKNQHLYWGVLERLFDDLFKGDVFQYVNGVPKDQVIDSIARHMENLPDYIQDDDEEMNMASIQEKNTEIKSNANRVYHYLSATGWLSIEKEGYREFILLDPTISQLLHNLTEIATNNPVYFGGKVQAIYNTVAQSTSDPYGQAPAFHQICLDSRSFFRSLSAIVVRIKDINKRITGTSKSKDILDTFFGDFVSNILVADYKKLKTENHPFRFRADILRVAQSIQYDDEMMEEYIKGYIDKLELDKQTATTKFNDDIATLVSVFSNIDKQLDRIDDIKHQLESRVSGLIRFMGRTNDFESSKIKVLIRSLVKRNDAVAMPLLGDDLASELNLYKPKKVGATTEPKPLKKIKRDPLLEIKTAMRRDANARRHVTANKLSDYIERHMLSLSAISSDELTIQSIDDYCSFVALSNLSVQSKTSNNQMRNFFTNYSIAVSSNGLTENDHLIVPKIIITRIKNEVPHATRP